MQKGTGPKVHGATEPDGAVWTWFIGIVAVGLFAWGVADLVGVGAGEPAAATWAPAAAEIERGGRSETIVELHRLLPDATDDLGRLVAVDGTVVGEASAAGFWVRDLRDNIVFVGDGSGGHPRIEAGDEVRVVGRVALLPPGEQADRLERAGLVIPATAVVIRDVKVQPMSGGIEVLRD
ncbi:MAG TPA: hypothetical protein VF158_13335 [Longimicrobiales bacterium]